MISMLQSRAEALASSLRRIEQTENWWLARADFKPILADDSTMAASVARAASPCLRSVNSSMRRFAILAWCNPPQNDVAPVFLPLINAKARHTGKAESGKQAHGPSKPIVVTTLKKLVVNAGGYDIVCVMKIFRRIQTQRCAPHRSQSSQRPRGVGHSLYILRTMKKPAHSRQRLKSPHWIPLCYLRATLAVRNSSSTWHFLSHDRFATRLSS